MTQFEREGRSVDASFDVSVDGDRLVVILHARGGSGSQARNREYGIGLLLALERIRSIGGEVTDALVDSAPAKRLSTNARRLALSQAEYPLRLVEFPGDLNDIAKDLMRAQVAVGQSPGAVGGNSTKRIMLLVSVPGGVRKFAAGTEWLRSGSLDDETLFDESASSVSDVGVFDPTNERDARKRTLRAIAERRGQPEFRNELLRAYRRTCAFTRFDAEDALEAAHIRPFMGDHTNRVDNGLLLRADIHTLFDRRLTTIDVDAREGWRVILSSSLRDTMYGPLQGQVVHLPSRRADWPNTTAVRIHRSLSGL